MSFFRVFAVFFIIWFLLNLKTEGIDPFSNDFFPYTCFFSVSNTFISNARLKLTKIKKKLSCLRIQLYLKSYSGTGIFCEFCEIPNNTFFPLRATASEKCAKNKSDLMINHNENEVEKKSHR